MNKGLRGLFLISLAACFAVNAHAEDAFLSLNELADGGTRVEGGFLADVSRDVAWRTLTDYSHISGFVSSLKASRIHAADMKGLFVQQEGTAWFFLFSRTLQVLLRIREKPPEEIEFEDVSQHDFDYYVGSWEIKSHNGSVWVLYALSAKPNFSVPRFISRAVLKRTVSSLLRDVKAEMLRRGPPGIRELKKRSSP